MKRTKEGSKQLFRARISLLVASCFILTLILSSVTVFAVETNKKKTALQKTLGATLVACITTDNAYNIPAFHRGVTGANVKSRDIFTGDLWSVSGYFREIWEGLPDWSMVGVDPIVQLVVDGKYTDGKIGCSNELMNTAMSSLGVYDDYEELICGADGTGGIMVTSNEKTCIANLREGTGEFKPNPDTAARKSHAYKLLSKNVGNLATDLVELYYNMASFFTTACATGKATFGETSDPLKYSVMAYNEDTKQLEPAYYTARIKPGEPVQGSAATGTWTCDNIAETLSSGSIFEAYKSYLEEQIAAGGNPLDYAAITGNTVATATSQEGACYDGAGVIGWIICPAITTLTSFLNKMYEDIEEHFLILDAQNIFSDDSGTYTSWTKMRDIANIVFIVLFFIVIISQITGIGIDNYGIKRILPKLVVVAILINLSYIICQLAVDVSNIVGWGLKGFFGTMTVSTGTDVIPSDPTGAQYAVTLVGIGAVSFVAFLVNPGFILAILMFVATMVISVLFLWLTLIAREAGIILAIVVSPIAFACNLLPNTEKIYKRWFEAFKGLLMLYPICSFVVGAGTLAGTIFIGVARKSENSVGLTLAAMIVPVLPYFFIPSLIRGSMQVMGNLGNRIQSLGRTVNKGTVGRVANSEMMKRARVGMSNSDITGLRTRLANSKFGKMTGLQKSRARQIAAADKQRKENSAATALLQKEATIRAERRDPNSVSEAALQEQMANANRANNQDKFHSIYTEYERRYGASKAANGLMRVIDNQANQTQGLLAGRNRPEFLRSLAEQHNSLSKTPDFLKYLQAGGLREINGRGMVHTSFAGANADGTDNFITENINVGDFSPEQIAASNADTMVRLIDNGKFTQETARGMIRNKSIVSRMDETQRLIAANLAVNGTRLFKREAEQLLAGRNQWNDRENYTGRGGAGAPPIPTSISPADVQALLQPLAEEVNLASANPDVVVNSNVIQTNTNQQNPVVVRLEPRNSQSNTLVVPHAPAQSNSTSQRSARQNIENQARNINPNDRRRPPLS